MSRTLVVLAVLAVALTAVPAAADHGDIHPTFRGERTFFQCQSQQVKVDNVQATQGTLATWSTQAPTGAFASNGDGCTSVETTVRSVGPVALDTHWEGTFTGNLQQLTVELHDISQRARNPQGTTNFIVNLWVDGVQRIVDAAVTPVPVEGNMGVTHGYRFSITDLGLATEDGDGEQVRTYRLGIRSRDANAFVWGATEVPAGIAFNPKILETAKIS